MNPLLIWRRGMMRAQAAGPQSGTLEVYPSTYDEAASHYSSISNVTGAYTSATSTTFCTVYIGQYDGAEGYILFKFDTSSIPSNAVIDNVTCVTKIYGNAFNRTVQMYAGNTAHGTASTWSNLTTLTMDMGGAWTRAEVADIGIRLYGTSSSAQNRYLRLYGATLTIEWHTN